ncbi:hypothetical protein DITRI_Ditri06bG0029900 [Diplodiscus trichospermus]
MRNMEVRVTSREIIKPYSSEVHLLKPFKLSFLDQLAPTIYVPLIVFHTQSQSSDSSSNSAQISGQLKRSLSQTLNHFYPFSGRPRDNLYIDSYAEGVPFFEARVNRCLSDYLLHDTDELNGLLPFKSFCNLPDPIAPLLAVQLNTFDCGGIALAVCTSHKIADASTASVFLTSWSAFSRGSDGKIPRPDLLSASSQFFPPMDTMPQNNSVEKSIRFNEDRSKTRRFVFDQRSIDTLKFIVKSKSLEHPTRVQAVTAFIWKYAMLASRSASGISKPSVCMQSMSIRRRLEPELPDYSIGNMSWGIISRYNSADNDIDLQNLAYLVKEGLENFNKDDLDRLRSEGVKFMSEKLDEASAELGSGGDIEFYLFSSWLNLFREVDFGWGEPGLLDIPGVVSEGPFSNTTILKEFGQNKQEIEAWITLKEKRMAILENDPEFLAFASPNPHSNKSKI